MRTLLAVSPHLDDAVFSVGALLAEAVDTGWRVVVVTCFTATVPDPQGFALACQLDKGLAPEVDYMALRRAEDEAACALLDVEAIHLPLPEAPHRGYNSAPALFGDQRPDDEVLEALRSALAPIVDDLAPDRVLGPEGIGNHIDHRIVRGALESIFVDHERWADLPYAARRPELIPAGAVRYPCDDRLPRKLAACAAYRSQTGFQFGDDEAMQALVSVDGDELLFS